MQTVPISHILRYAGSYHGNFQSVSEGSFMLVTRYGQPHVVLAPGNMASILNNFAKAEKSFRRMTPAEQASTLSELNPRDSLRDFINRLAKK